MKTILSDFIKYETVDQNVVLKYQNILPKELVDVWENYGFGTLANDFLKIINPDDYLDILESSYLRHDQAIPIFTTAMGDIIV